MKQHDFILPEQVKSITWEQNGRPITRNITCTKVSASGIMGITDGGTSIYIWWNDLIKVTLHNGTVLPQ